MQLLEFSLGCNIITNYIPGIHTTAKTMLIRVIFFCLSGPQFCQRLLSLLSSWIPLFFILFQLFRLVSLVMFAIFVVYCTLYCESSSVDCQGFSVYHVTNCDAFCWKAVWLICSILTSVIFIALLNQWALPNLRPVSCVVIRRCLLCKPYFWSLNITMAFVVAYDILIMVINHQAKISVECLVIISKLCTLYLIYQLNFTFPPSRAKNFRPISRAAYCITLTLFVLDNLCKFLVLSTEVAFKFYTINSKAPKPLTIVILMLMIVNGSIYHSFLVFFWQKLFRGDDDILGVIKQKFSDTRGINDFMQDRADGGV